MAEPHSSQSTTLRNLLQEAQENFNAEFIGFLLFVVGGILFFSLAGTRTAGSENIPWLVGMTGWTAPLVVLSFLGTGGVLMLGHRAGYWSVEAIIGIELFLLSLQAGTFAWYNDSVTWRTPIDGANGGLVGWSFGSLLVAALGQWPTLAILTLTGLIALRLLFRYTPLIYVVLALPRLVPSLPPHWFSFQAVTPHAWLPSEGAHSGSSNQHKKNALQASNFVSPHQARRETTIEHASELSANKPAEKAPRKRAVGPEPVAIQSVSEQKLAVDKKSSSEPKAKAPKADKAPKTMMPTPKVSRPNSDLPALDLLAADAGVIKNNDVRALQQLIETTLEDFNVPVKVVHVESGPTVTQFGVEPLFLERGGQRRKVRVNRIANLADDLALALAAPSVRIEAPVPGRPYVGIEVPNLIKIMVTLRGILESNAMVKEGGKLTLPLGRNTSGEPVVMDLTRAPHILIAGATGSGKSACINTIITGLLMQHGPDTLRFVMVDPKMVELPGYNGIPHLLGKVITDVDQVMGALTWLLLQMDDRYRLFQQLGVRNIDTYNGLVSQQRKGDAQLERLPYIVLIIDELADLMMTAAEDIERQICRLAQMARATGIHLILATQRPSVDVVTGLIKANFPTRIAFSVTSQMDSRVILDTPGAERLLGQGDMLMMRSDAAKLFRVQGCYVGDEEITRVAQFWKNYGAGAESPSVSPWAGLLDRMDDEDELLQDAIDVVRDMKSCSTSMLQRKLRVGYPKAAGLMDALEAKGVVGPDMGGGQGREVLLKNKEEEVGEPSDEN
ncbi:MAG: DNA translocase FtsK [Chloroflexi bacterium]|nr:DNA translocase FtsK [Chloroflexota bacterium]